MRFGIRHTGAFVALLVSVPLLVHAQSAGDLQSQIDAQNAQINQLDSEIAQYQKQLDATSAKKQTLQSQLSQLDISIKKTTASIQKTQAQIHSTQLQIEQLASGISKTQGSIQTEQDGLAESIRTLARQESESLAIQMLSGGTVASVWRDFSTAQMLQSAIDSHVVSLNSAKQVLTNTKTATEDKKAQLVKQQNTLQSQQGSLNAQKKAQSDLLAQTKSQESAYQAIIAQKKSQESQMEQALADLKSQYNEVVNPDQITTPGIGVLQWPVAGKIIITQYFGDTPFAQAHSSLYSGHGHDGLDIGVPIGTPILAALAGTVLATGNTDAVKGCYSFGKWVMVQHANGINTMYAHLSQIGVSQGQAVSTGQVIGYSGETGYATGPHLHFGVYVSAVTKIVALGVATQSTTPCSKAVMPVPPLSGYLNPLNYLPT